PHSTLLSSLFPYTTLFRSRHIFRMYIDCADDHSSLLQSHPRRNICVMVKYRYNDLVTWLKCFTYCPAKGESQGSHIWAEHYLIGDRKSTRLNSSHQIISYA